MPFFFAFLIGLILPANASVQLSRLTIQNLNLDYNLPFGPGTADKLLIGISGQKELPGPLQLEVHRTEKSFSLKTPHIEFDWDRPEKFFHDLEKVYTDSLNVQMEKKDHSLNGKTFIFRPMGGGNFLFQNFDFKCQGLSVDEELMNRVLDDCKQSMTGKIKHLDIPLNLSKAIASSLPDIKGEEDFPANDFGLSVDDGWFSMKVRIKYIFRAHIWAWGKIDYEDDRKTLAIRMDRIKYGYIPITNRVMRELRSRINHPNVRVEPPYIRIKLSE